MKDDNVALARPRTMQWLTGATPTQKRALLTTALGWMLDSMDMMLFSLVLVDVQRDLHLSTALAGLIMSFSLISAAIGGVFFGWFADKVGRVRALMVSMLVYSIFTGACGLSHTILQLAIFRFILGLGIGGEWAAGGALVAETWPDKDRGKAIGIAQASWAVGYALGAAITGLVMPHFGWRAVFFVGVLPALVTIWMRRSVKEPEIWQEKAATLPLRNIFRGKLGITTLITASMNAASLFAWWGLFTWIPRFLSLPVAQGGRGLSIVQTSSWTIIMQVGTGLGYLSFGYLADRFGRKRTYIAFLLIAAAIVPIYAHAQGVYMLLILGPIVGFFGTGFFSGFSIIASEAFPTAVRGTAMGLVYNVGRFLGAAAPYIIGYITESSGIVLALSSISIAFLFAAVIATGLTETKSHALA
ncbi:MAG TPA: MFS transporter [Acidobacteriaceae bacterium]|nr:MFS transporter [Acidobacteriaceae bacterium]